MSKPVYLGKMHLHWCKSCNVPVLGKKCGCGAKTTKVTVIPPGDIRPAFEHDIEHINSNSTKLFNVPLISPERLVVLNKTPYDDRMDEIIVARNELARHGILVEPSGAVSYAGACKVKDTLIGQTIVCIATGHGLKDMQGL